MGKRTVKQGIQKSWREFRHRWGGLKQKEKIILAGAGIFLLAGLCILLAPKAAKQQRLREQEELTEVILSGGETIEIGTDMQDGVIAFYESDADEPDYFGEPPAMETPEDEQTERTEIIGLGILEIEKIGLRLPVAEGATKTTLKVAVGHVSETAAIGQDGNAVIAGHRSYTRGEYFNRLDELAVGDSVMYTTKDGTVYHFEVIEVRTLEPSDSSVFDIRAGECDLTLYTCTPVRVASHRLAVRCKLVEKMTIS